MTNLNSNTVSVVDTATNSVLGAIDVGSEPNGVAVSPNGSTVYVADYGSGSVSAINTESPLVATINVGRFPISVAVIPNGTSVYSVGNFHDTVWSPSLQQ